MTLLEERVMENVFYLRREPMNQRPINVMNNSNLFMIFDKTYIKFYLLSPSSRFNLNRLLPFNHGGSKRPNPVKSKQYQYQWASLGRKNVSPYLKNQ